MAGEIYQQGVGQESESLSQSVNQPCDPTDPSHECFQTLDVTRVRRALAKLHEQVACGRGRLEIKKRGCDDVCVMISKAELEALESALEILTGSAEYKTMCETLSQVASDAGGYVPAQV